jgi:hypothetical protein
MDDRDSVEIPSSDRSCLDVTTFLTASSSCHDQPCHELVYKKIPGNKEGKIDIDPGYLIIELESDRN